MSDLSQPTLHDFAALRRFVLLRGEDRFRTAKAPEALQIIAMLCLYASYGAVAGAFMSVVPTAIHYGIFAVNVMFGSLVTAGVFALVFIALGTVSEGDWFDWKLPGATIREKLCCGAGVALSFTLGGVLPVLFLCWSTQPFACICAFVSLIVISVNFLSCARNRRA